MKNLIVTQTKVRRSADNGGGVLPLRGAPTD